MLSDHAGVRAGRKRRCSRRLTGLLLPSGFSIAIAAGLAVFSDKSRECCSACESMARNPAARPAIQVALFVGLAFIESLVLFTFVIIFIKVV